MCHFDMIKQQVLAVPLYLRCSPILNHSDHGTVIPLSEHFRSHYNSGLCFIWFDDPEAMAEISAGWHWKGYARKYGSQDSQRKILSGGTVKLLRIWRVSTMRLRTRWMRGQDHLPIMLIMLFLYIIWMLSNISPPKTCLFMTFIPIPMYGEKHLGPIASKAGNELGNLFPTHTRHWWPLVEDVFNRFHVQSDPKLARQH